MLACQLNIVERVGPSMFQRNNMVNGRVIPPIASSSVFSNPRIIWVNGTATNSTQQTKIMCNLLPSDWSAVCRLPFFEGPISICVMDTLCQWFDGCRYIICPPFAIRPSSLLAFFSFQVLPMLCLATSLATTPVMHVHCSRPMLRHLRKHRTLMWI